MSTEITMLKPETTPPFVACIGLDWGDQSHAVALQPVQGKTESGTLVNSPEVLHTWLQELAQRFEGRPVALAVETSRGPLIHVFSAYPWLTVYPIHPATSARYRAAFKPSGAKDDLPDALLLLELVRDHRHKLRPPPDSRRSHPHAGRPGGTAPRPGGPAHPSAPPVDGPAQKLFSSGPVAGRA